MSAYLNAIIQANEEVFKSVMIENEDIRVDMLKRAPTLNDEVRRIFKELSDEQGWHYDRMDS